MHHVDHCSRIRSEYFRPRRAKPDEVASEVRETYIPREAKVPVPLLDPVFQPWDDAKAFLAQKLGLRFGIAYTPLYQVATDSVNGQNQAAGSIFEVVGTWALVGRETSYPGTLGFRVEDRHRFGFDLAPQFLFTEIGAGWPTAVGFSEFNFSLAELWWEQHFIRDRIGLRAGKMLPFAIFDFFQFKSPKTGFTNAVFTLNPTIGWPQFGLGAAGFGRPREDIYIVAGIHDANGSPTRSGFDTFFEDREYFVIGEIGWDPGYLKDGVKNPSAPDLHATFWHVDKRKKAGRPEGWGFTVSGQKAFGDFVAFLRYGYSDGGAALLEHMVSGGVALIDAFGWQQDVIGLGLSWGRPSNRMLDDQGTAELYYKMQLTKRLALTPSAQLMANPSANPDRDLLAVFGIRARFDF